MKQHRSWESKPATIRLRLLGASLKDVRAPTFDVLDRIQHLPADKQLLAVFAAGVLMATAINEDPHGLIIKIRKMLTEATRTDSAADALGDYARGELM